jgi:hypothetical protein
MYNSKSKKLTDLGRVFIEPTNSTHRQYEALRAFFVDGLPSKEAAKRFGYTQGSFRVLVHEFRQNPRRQFFLAPAKGPQAAPKKGIRFELWSLPCANKICPFMTSAKC